MEQSRYSKACIIRLLKNLIRTSVLTIIIIYPNEEIKGEAHKEGIKSRIQISKILNQKDNIKEEGVERIKGI